MLHSSKLVKCYFGPFQVLCKIGVVAYKLLLSEGSHIYSVVHISQLCQYDGTSPRVFPCPLPSLEKSHLARDTFHVLEPSTLPKTISTTFLSFVSNSKILDSLSPTRFTFNQPANIQPISTVHLFHFPIKPLNLATWPPFIGPFLLNVSFL